MSGKTLCKSFTFFSSTMNTDQQQMDQDKTKKHTETNENQGSSYRTFNNEGC